MFWLWLLCLADYALSKQTVIAGNESCSFRHSSNKKTITHRGKKLFREYAVALVFARERTSLDGIACYLHFSYLNASFCNLVYSEASMTCWLNSVSCWINYIIMRFCTLVIFILKQKDGVYTYEGYYYKSTILHWMI